MEVYRRALYAAGTNFLFKFFRDRFFIAVDIWGIFPKVFSHYSGMAYGKPM